MLRAPRCVLCVSGRVHVSCPPPQPLCGVHASSLTDLWDSHLVPEVPWPQLVHTDWSRSLGERAPKPPCGLNMELYVPTQGQRVSGIPRGPVHLEESRNPRKWRLGCLLLGPESTAPRPGDPTRH